MRKHVASNPKKPKEKTKKNNNEDSDVEIESEMFEKEMKLLGGTAEDVKLLKGIKGKEKKKGKEEEVEDEKVLLLFDII